MSKAYGSITDAQLSAVAGGGAFGTPLVPVGSTQTIDWSVASNQTLDLSSATSTVTLTFTNPADGGQYFLRILPTASAPLVWPASVFWPEGTPAPTIGVSVTEVNVRFKYHSGSTKYLATMEGTGIALVEAGGTTLTMSSVNNNEFLKRSGSSLVGSGSVVTGTGTFPNLVYWSGSAQVSDTSIPYTSVVVTGDSRLSDARSPLSGFTDSVSAAGGSQGAATLLTTQWTRVTGGNTLGVRLPTGRPAGEMWVVHNDAAALPGVGTNYIACWAGSGETIRPASINSFVTVAATATGLFMSCGSGLWSFVEIPGRGDATSTWYGQNQRFAANAIFDNDVTLSSVAIIGRTNKTEAHTTAYSVVAADSGKTFTNVGASANVTFTLPVASIVGLNYVFVNFAAHNVVARASGSDVIWVGTNPSSAGGTVTSSSQVEVMEIACISSGIWIFKSYVGTSFTPA